MAWPINLGVSGFKLRYVSRFPINHYYTAFFESAICHTLKLPPASAWGRAFELTTYWANRREGSQLEQKRQWGEVTQEIYLSLDDEREKQTPTLWFMDLII